MVKKGKLGYVKEKGPKNIKIWVFDYLTFIFLGSANI